MVSGNLIALIGFAYILLLFSIAYFGDRDSQKVNKPYNTNVVYALSLAVYCSSWTFYGAVGTAAVDGLDYLAIYLGPCLVFLFGYPVVRRIILICKQNSITTISDFLSSRYGKSRRIAILVTVIAVAGSLPYIALQLKAVSASFAVLSSQDMANGQGQAGLFADNVGLIVTAGLVLFTILFGTRHLDATEHHKGLILAIAFESIVKLVAILAVGYYAIYLLLDSTSQNNFNELVNNGSLQTAFGQGSSTWVSFSTKLLLSMSAIILLPRQFQVAIVEARDHRQFKTAMWVMPVYLVLTSVIVIPIALSGIVLLPNSQEDMYVLSLPITAGNNSLAIIAFIGGLSAATGMVVVAAISLSTMICNDWVMPLLIRRNGIEFLKRDDLNNVILRIRRYAILGLMFGAYVYYLFIDSNQQLANIGLVSFAAIAQLLPATLSAIFWRGAHSKGVFYGMVFGFVLWSYTLVLPTIIPIEIIGSLFGNSWFHPQHLFGLSVDNNLTHGVVWSLGVNIAIISFYSLRDSQSVIERLQASRFFFADTVNRHSDEAYSNDYQVSPNELFIVAERIIGVKSSKALFSQYEQRTGTDLKAEQQADEALISTVQTAIAGVIGTVSAQRVISDGLLGDQEYLGELTHLVDETSSVLKFNRHLLQTTLENITHGIAVVDEDLNLVIWNDNYLKMFDYPESLIYVGKPIREVFEYSAERGDFKNKDAAAEIAKRVRYLQQRSPYTTVRETVKGVILKATGEPMPRGGFVTTYQDITGRVEADKKLKQANEELESRVQERTLKLESLTKQLEQNTRSKTHFLAAASHDLLQPINAARLFAHSISERAQDPDEVSRLSKSIDQSLTTANDLLRALLDISKLDAGGIEADYKVFSALDFLQKIESEMQASANDKNVNLRVDCESVYVLSDRQLLFSVMLNLVANALRYTPSGGSVILHGRADGLGNISLSVKDTGLGIESEHLEHIFTEFYQVKDNERRHSRGLGLGLSIVARICALLGVKVDVESQVGHGSVFTILMPQADTPSISKPVESMAVVAPLAKLNGARILCLDNDESVLTAMHTMLEGWGCDVIPVLSYEDAVKQFNDNDFDVVLADYRLDGDSTGLDFLKYCLDHNGGQQQGVLITAEQNKVLQGKAAEFGFMYLDKPVEPASIKSLLIYLLAD